MASKRTGETRSFSVAPAIIYNLILRQAGSLGKAVLEAVMNSVDAEATAVDIVADRTSLRICDNGRGFRSRQEILDWFEVFGFDHMTPGNDRVYGQFGIGRGQLWSFASTVWRTNEFVMDVDIKNRGLDYELVETDNLTPGLVIEAKFYDTLTTAELLSLEAELKDLCKYTATTVTFNGATISQDPAKEKWDFETNEAWIRLRESGPLAVYNIGVLVNKFPAYRFGASGVVVTKPDQQLTLNMARNDIVVSDCQVWKKVAPFLKDKADKKSASRKERLSEDQLATLVRRMKAGERFEPMMREALVITDVRNRSMNFSGFVNALNRALMKLTQAPEGDAVGEKAHRQRLAMVLADKTLTRFGVESVAEFVEVLALINNNYEGSGWDNKPLRWRHAGKVEVFESLEAMNLGISESHDLIDRKELRPVEKAAFLALGRHHSNFAWMLRRTGLTDSEHCRVLHVGESQVAEAWTDGSSYVALERRMLRLLNKGLAGALKVLYVLAHEYMHKEANTGTHVHDLEFYEQFHDWTIDNQGEITKNAMSLLESYIRELKHAERKVTNTAMAELVAVEESLRELVSFRAENEQPAARLAA